MLTIFLVIDGWAILRNLVRQIPDPAKRLRVGAVMAFAYRRWARYQLCVLAKAVVIGAVVYVVATVCDLPAATVVALVAGLASTIPMVGTAVGSIPLVLLAAGFSSPLTAVVVTLLAIALQVGDHLVMRRVIEPRAMPVGPIVPVIITLVVGQEFGLGAAVCTIGIVTFVMALDGGHAGLPSRRPRRLACRSTWGGTSQTCGSTTPTGSLGAGLDPGRAYGHLGRDGSTSRRLSPPPSVSSASLAGAKVADYLYTCPEYVESMFAMFKAGVVPVNTNYRYTDHELAYLWDNADAEAIVFHGAFTTALRRRCAVGCRAYVPGCGSTTAPHPCPAWATPYEDAAAIVADRACTRRTAAPATTSTCSTRAAPRACPRA